MTERKRGRPDQNTRHTDGRYHQGMEEAMCRCGHTLGCHTAAGPVNQRTCSAHELPGGPPDVCACEGFKKAKESK